MAKYRFAIWSGIILSALYFLFVALVVVEASGGNTRLFGLDYENLVVFTAPDIAMLPWVFYSGLNPLSVANAIAIFIGFLVVRFAIGFAWGWAFVFLRLWYLRAIFIVATLIALVLYGNFVVYNAVSIEQISKTSNTVEDCLAYKDSASGYMPICVKEVALKNNDPDLCLRLEDMGWDGFSYNCLEAYAYARNDPAICAKMGDRGNGRDTCYAYFDQCEKIRSFGGTTQKDSCFIKRAANTRDKSHCEFVQNATRIDACICASQYGSYSSQCKEAQSKVVY